MRAQGRDSQGPPAAASSAPSEGPASVGTQAPSLPSDVALHTPADRPLVVAPQDPNGPTLLPPPGKVWVLVGELQGGKNQGIRGGKGASKMDLKAVWELVLL